MCDDLNPQGKGPCFEIFGKTRMICPMFEYRKEVYYHSQDINAHCRMSDYVSDISPPSDERTGQGVVKK